jgi:hypothetical protein
MQNSRSTCTCLNATMQGQLEALSSATAYRQQSDSSPGYPQAAKHHSTSSQAKAVHPACWRRDIELAG